MPEVISGCEPGDGGSDLVPQSDASEPAIVTVVGVPGTLHPRRFVPAADAIAVFRTAPPVDGTRLRSDLDEVIDQVTAPRC